MTDCFSVSNAAELLNEMKWYIDNPHDCDAINMAGIVSIAVDAIEQLLAENGKLKANAIHWHKITTRPLYEEEKEWYAEQGYEPCEMPEFMYDCEMPEDGQEILIATPWGTDKDICSNDAEYGIGLECHDDFDNVYAWAEMPKYGGINND